MAGQGAGDTTVAQLPLKFARQRRRPQVPYWHTTPLTREQLAGAILVAEQQDEAVLAIFRGTAGPLSPSQVWQIGVDGGRGWLLTSVRRSITNLANAGVLVHLSAMRPGPYVRPEGLWSLPVEARAA